MRLPPYLALLAAAGVCKAHMAMTYPAPLKSNVNPNTPPGDADYSYTNPLSVSGSDYPCKGYLSLLGTAAAAPVDSWIAGQEYSATITGGALHNGGSCQISVSVDGGSTFRVIHSYIGGCPGNSGDSFLKFTLPADTPSSEQAILAWSWFNNLGNREMYMNCAVISITGGGGGGGGAGGGGGGFSSRPSIFRANTNGCRTQESRDVMIPNPGPDVDLNNPDAVPPIGDCEGGRGATGSGGGDGSGVSVGGGGGGGGGVGSGEDDHGHGNSRGNGNRGSTVAVESQQILVIIAAIIVGFCLHCTWFNILV